MTPSLVVEACQTLKRNRAQYLLPRSSLNIVHVIAAAAASWLDPSNPFREMALCRAVAETGFSKETVARGLEMFFRQLTTDNLHALMFQDLGHFERLDQFTVDRFSPAAALARGPELLVHVTGGLLPNPPIFSMVLGLLTRSAQFIKCASGTSLLPRLFAHTIYETEPKLAACIEIAEWPGGDDSIERPLFAEADCVTVTGSDDSVAAVKARIPAQVRVLAYGHRVSFGYIGAEALARYELPQTVKAAAWDVAAWDQLGCLSPHIFYVESGVLSAEAFAQGLAQELAILESLHPRRPLSVDEAAAIAARRGFYEVRSSGSEGTRIWQSEGSTAWTVVYEADPQFQLSCLNRFIYVKPVTAIDDAIRWADPVRGQVSTVALAVGPDRSREIAMRLARWGVTRICRLGDMQNPPLTWRHDGRPSLGDLVTWTDWEQ